MRKRTILKMSAIVAAWGLVFAMFLTGCTWFDNDNGDESTNVTSPAGNTIAEQFEWMRNNAQNNSSFVIDVNIGENVAPQNLYFDGMTVGITIRGTGAMRTIGLYGNGSLFTVGSGVTLTLDNNITLRGVQNNNASLVQVSNGGTLVMNDGAAITGNVTSANGGGVGVSGGGTFVMHGGSISNNTARSNTGSIQGAGVHVNGTFDMRGGEISDNTATGYAWAAGGGVAIGCYVRGLFIMRGEIISGNTVISNDRNWANGGGINVNGYHPAGGTFQISGGVISDSNIGRHVENMDGGSSVLYIGTYGANSATAQRGTFNSAGVFTSLGDLQNTNAALRITNGEPERPSVPPAFFDLATYARFQNLQRGETDPLAIFDSPILQPGGWPSQVAFEIVGGQSGNALRVHTIENWVGFDLMHSGFDFRAGDFIKVAGTALTDAQMLLNTYHAGWRSLGSTISVQAGNTFLFERTLTQADVDNILANTGIGANPQSIRIRANAPGTVFEISEITVGRFTTEDGGHLGPTLNLGGQVWGSGTVPLTGNRQVTSSVGGSGVITNGLLSFTIGTPSHLVNAWDVLDDVLGGNFTNINVSNAGARVAFIDNLETSSAGHLGVLWRGFWDGVTEYLVAYIFADRNFTVTGNGRTFSEARSGSTTITTTQNFNVSLRAGWNVVYQRFVYGVSGGMETINISVGLGDPVRARWILDEYMSVTITGIPARYHGDWGDLYLYMPGTLHHLTSAMAFPVNSSTSFRLASAEPGVYDIVLWLNDYGVRYILPSRNITAGASIPFGDFTLATSPWAFSDNLERSEQRPYGRSRMRPLRARQ